MNAKIIQISLDLLTELLHLPPGVKITGIDKKLINPYQIELLIESPEFPEVPKYWSVPSGKLIHHSEFCEVCNFTNIVKAEITD